MRQAVVIALCKRYATLCADSVSHLSLQRFFGKCVVQHVHFPHNRNYCVDRRCMRTLARTMGVCASYAARRALSNEYTHAAQL